MIYPLTDLQYILAAYEFLVVSMIINRENNRKLEIKPNEDVKS